MPACATNSAFQRIITCANMNGLIAFCDTPAFRHHLNNSQPGVLTYVALPHLKHPFEMQIFTVSLSGIVSQLTDMSPGLFQPQWSPDGKRIAVVRVGNYTGTQHPTHEVWVLQVHGSLSQRPTAHRFRFVTRGMWPAWAPNGSMMSFARLDQRGLIQLWVLDMITKRERQLTFHGHHGRSTWSPDGTELAFWRVAELFLFGNGAMIEADGRYARDREGKPMSSHYAMCPRQRVKAGEAGEQERHFYRCSNQWPGHIYLMNSADGKNERPLTRAQPNPFLPGHTLAQNVPRWSRSNGGVVYWEGQIVTGPGDVMMSIPGDEHTPPVQLTHRSPIGAMADDPEWSPDGRWVAYASYHGGGIYIGVAYLIPGRGWHTQEIPSLTRLGGSIAPTPSWQDCSAVVRDLRSIGHGADNVNVQ